MPLQAPIWIPAAIFLYFYYRKNNKLPFPVGIWVNPLFGIAGMPEPVAPPPTPTPPTPDTPCPPCAPCAPCKDALSDPITLQFVEQSTSNNTTTDWTLTEYVTVGELPEVYKIYKEGQQLAKTVNGVDVSVVPGSIKITPGH